MGPLDLCQQFGARHMLRKLLGSRMGPPVTIHRLVFCVIVVALVCNRLSPRVLVAVACSSLLLMQSVEYSETCVGHVVAQAKINNSVS